MSQQHYVLRGAISGTPFASQYGMPSDFGFPVEWDGEECYWSVETITPPRRHCPECGAAPHAAPNPPKGTDVRCPECDTRWIV